MQCPYCYSSYHADCRYGREREDRGFRHEAAAARAEQSDLGLLGSRAGYVVPLPEDFVHAPDFTTCDPHRIGGAPLQPSPQVIDTSMVAVALLDLLPLLNRTWLLGRTLGAERLLSEAEDNIIADLVQRRVVQPRDQDGYVSRVKRKE